MNRWLLKPSSIEDHLRLYRRSIISRSLSSCHDEWDGSHGSYLIDHISDMYKQTYLSKSLRKGKASKKFKQYNNIYKIPALDLHKKKPFSLILPRSTMPVMKTNNKDKTSSGSLLDGVVLLKNYISLGDQVEIVNVCQELCSGPRGFYEPTHSHGGKLRLHMMCFGRNWDPKTKYNKQYRSDGSEAPPAPPIPGKLVSLVKRSLQDCQVYENSRDEFPSIHPDICVAKFYTTTGLLGIFQEDGHHSEDSVKRRLPLVSFFIGDSAEILLSRYYGSYYPDKVLLESGDVLIYNGYNRYLYYGVKRIIPESAPLPLLNETMLRPGCLNLNLKQLHF